MTQVPAKTLAAGLAVLLSVMLAVAVLLPSGLVREVDWHVHLCWLQGFSGGLLEGTWYPRWMDGANEGMGGAVFLYYAPLSYYVGSVFVALGFSIASALKCVYFLSLVLCGAGIYRWLAPVAGNNAAATLAALGVMTPQLTLFSFLYNMPASALAVGVLPWVAHSVERGGGRVGRVAALSVALAVLVLAHTITAFQAMILLALVGMMALFRKNTRGYAAGVLLPSAILAVLMASAYIVPLWDSLALVHYEEFVRPQGWHILENLLFSSHAPSVRQHPDEAAFFETPNALALLLLVLAILRIALIGKNRVAIGWAPYAGIAVLSFALMTPLSAFLYERIEVLRYVQFGWRWQAVFFLCVLRVVAAALRPTERHDEVVHVAGERLRKWCISSYSWIVVAAVILGAIAAWNVKLIAPMLDVGHESQMAYRVDSDEARRHAERCIWRDVVYRPISMGGGWNRPLDHLPREPRAVSGRVHIISANLENQRKRYEIVADIDSRIVFPVLNFPGWIVLVDEMKSIAEGIPDDGRIVVAVDRGRHHVELRWESSPVMRMANALSGGAFAIWVGMCVLSIRRVGSR